MTSSTFCHYCGKMDPKYRCASCHEMCYCTKGHQVAHWKRVHKKSCKYITESPLSIWVEVRHGEGNGIHNPMIQHIFSNKAEGYEYVKAQNEFANDCTSRPLRSPYCELLGWDVEMYCSTLFNRVHLPNGGLVDVIGNGELSHINGAGIYLGCDIQSGITRHVDVEGRIFVTGRNQKGRTLTVDILWGILSFIWDCMSLYGRPDGSGDTDTLARWCNEYRQGIWQPKGGNDANIDVYCVIAENCRAEESYIDHTL